LPSSPREVFRPAAIIAGAAAIVLAHNHPSGNPEPSKDDIVASRRLQEAGDILGVPLLDHVIVGRRSRRHPSGLSSLLAMRFLGVRE